MGVLFLLKQHHEDLAAAEAKSCAYGWGWWQHKEQPADGTLYLKTRKVPQHLGLSRFATKVIAVCSPRDVEETLAGIKTPVKGSFKLVLTSQASNQYVERDLATIAWNRLKRPKVDLASPDTIIDVIITAKEAYIGIRAWTNAEDFEARRAHLLPAAHPTGMHPAVARALVNLACARTVHDPFCGSGGILIEAALGGRHASGADIDPAMVARARKNLAHFRLKPELRVADATLWSPRVQALVADLPYGRGTRPVALKPLLDAFLHRAAQSTKRAVIGLPAEIPMPKGWIVRAHFGIYVHKSMTRHFYVLEAR